MPRKRGTEYSNIVNQTIQGMQKEKTVEEREKMPDKACGKCKEFFHITSGMGNCNKLKGGSDLKVDPPVYLTEGDAHMSTMFNMDASKCKYYDEMELIDTDISQSNDPRFSRHQRQMQK